MDEDCLSVEAFHNLVAPLPHLTSLTLTLGVGKNLTSRFRRAFPTFFSSAACLHSLTLVFWTGHDLDEQSSIAPAELLRALFDDSSARLPPLKSLLLITIPQIQSSLLQEFLKAFEPTLEWLAIEGVNVSDGSWNDVLMMIRNELHLRYLHFASNGISGRDAELGVRDPAVHRLPVQVSHRAHSGLGMQAYIDSIIPRLTLTTPSERRAMWDE